MVSDRCSTFQLRRVKDDLVDIMGPTLFKMTRLFIYAIVSVHLSTCMYYRVKIEAAEVMKSLG